MDATLSKAIQPPADAAHQFLELYYPIHYKAGIGVEDALRGSELTRHQTAILWLIHSQGDEGRRMRRKDIVSALSNWFEISNAAITKALRGMSVAPLALVKQTEDPDSGREKVVTHTSSSQNAQYVLTIFINFDSNLSAFSMSPWLKICIALTLNSMMILFKNVESLSSIL